MPEKKCISCSMPMTRPADFPLEDSTKDFCVHCADDSGELKPYDAILDGMTQFIVGGQGLDQGVARTMAEQMLSTMPAWADRSA